MKRLFLLLLLLTGCSSIQVNWNHPDNPIDYCQKTGTCSTEGHPTVLQIRISQK
jgi:hypothetical protein